MIAEESTSWPGVTNMTENGGLGFGLKWNMGWMNDTLRYLAEEPINRRYHHGEITFSLVYAFSEQFMLPSPTTRSCTEKAPCTRKCREMTGRNVPVSVPCSLTSGPTPVSSSSSWARSSRRPANGTSRRGLDWWMLDQPSHAGLQRLVASLNRIYRDTPALWARDNDPGGFSWIDGGNVSDSLIAFIRHDHDGGSVACVHNFSGVPIEGYRLRLPHAGTWLELLNSDAEEFGGSGVGNLGRVEAIEGDHGAVATIRVPPFGGLMLKPAAPADQ